jgi:hypothetical protein
MALQSYSKVVGLIGDREAARFPDSSRTRMSTTSTSTPRSHSPPAGSTTFAPSPSRRPTRCPFDETNWAVFYRQILKSSNNFLICIRIYGLLVLLYARIEFQFDIYFNFVFFLDLCVIMFYFFPKAYRRN